MGFEDVYCIHLIWVSFLRQALVNMLINIQVPKEIVVFTAL
jgi:hypothetical protein